MSEFSTGLGWPAERDRPQVAGSYPQDDDPVSRETTPQENRVPDREPTPSPSDQQDPPRVRTAAEIEADPRAFDDHSTPLARAIEAELRVRERLSYNDPLPRPDHTRVMVVANQNGGVGKTTTTVNLAAALAMHDLRVLVVDLDPQGNASTALGVDHRRGTPSSYEVLVDGASVAEVVQQHADIKNLFVVPATIDLAGAEIELVSVVARESRLRKALAAYNQIGVGGGERLD